MAIQLTEIIIIKIELSSNQQPNPIKINNCWIMIPSFNGNNYTIKIESLLFNNYGSIRRDFDY